MSGMQQPQGFGMARSHLGQMPQLDMSSGIEAQSFIGSAFNAYQQGQNDREARQLRREQADYTRKLREQQLMEMGKFNNAGGPDQQVQLMMAQMQKQQAELETTTRELDKRQVFSAFDRYTSDGEARHLNSLLKNPRLQEMFGVISVNKLNLSDPEDLRMLSQEVGRDITPVLDSLNHDAIRGRIVKSMDAQGNVKLFDMQQLYAMTGYTKELDTRKQNELMQKLSMEKTAADTRYKNAMADKADRWEPSMGSSGSGMTAMQQNALAVGQAQERMASGDMQVGDEQLLGMYTEQVAGNSPGRQNVVDSQERELFRAFGGEDAFYATKFSPGTSDYRRAERNIRKLEDAAGIKLTSKQIETLGGIRKVIAAAESAKGLTEDDTGLVDSLLKKAGAYVSNDTVGAEATSAWAGIRNQLLHAFAGSAMNEGELARWGEQFGNLSQQAGPVLTTLATALNQLGGELDALRTALPEASFHVRLGADVNRLNTVIENVSQAAATLSNTANPKGNVKAITPSYPQSNSGQFPSTVRQANDEELAKLAELLKQRKEGK